MSQNETAQQDEVAVRRRTSIQRKKTAKYRKRRARFLKRRPLRHVRLTPSQKSAYRRMRSAGVYKKIARLRASFDAPQTLTAGEIAHPMKFVEAILDWATLAEWDDGPREFAKMFLGRHPVYSTTDTGLAALQFEAWLGENADGMFKKLVETEVDADEPTFLAIFEGKLSEEDYKLLTEKVDFVSFDTLVSAGDLDEEDGTISDVTVLEGSPEKGTVPVEEPAPKPTVTLPPPVEANTEAKLDFDAWYKEVNKSVEAKTGMSCEDMPDCPYADWHEEGMSPKAAAAKCIRMAKDEMESVSEEKWSGAVKTKWTPPEGFFKQSAEKIAEGLMAASDSVGQAMQRLNFYINRAGVNLDEKEKSTLEAAKAILSKKAEEAQEVLPDPVLEDLIPLTGPDYEAVVKEGGIEAGLMQLLFGSRLKETKHVTMREGSIVFSDFNGVHWSLNGSKWIPLAEEGGKWRTTDGGQRIYIEKGNITKGNPHVTMQHDKEGNPIPGTSTIPTGKGGSKGGGVKHSEEITNGLMDAGSALIKAAHQEKDPDARKAATELGKMADSGSTDQDQLDRVMDMASMMLKKPHLKPIAHMLGKVADAMDAAMRG